MATPTPTIESFSFNSFFIIEIKNWQRATVSRYRSRACTVMSRCELLSLNHIIVWSNHINSYWLLTMMVLTAAVGLLDALSDPLLRSDQPSEVSHQPRRSWHQRKFYSTGNIIVFLQKSKLHEHIVWFNPMNKICSVHWYRWNNMQSKRSMQQTRQQKRGQSPSSSPPPSPFFHALPPLSSFSPRFLSHTYSWYGKVELWRACIGKCLLFMFDHIMLLGMVCMITLIVQAIVQPKNIQCIYELVDFRYKLIPGSQPSKYDNIG